MNNYQILQGDVVEQLKNIPDDSISLIVTDPPYNLAMDDWDTWPSNKAFSEWCITWGVQLHRVLKPGGHIFSFGCGRTYHWMAVAMEQSGFVSRDMIEWVYWGTMPKSKNLKSCHEPIYVGCKGKPLPFNIETHRVPLDKSVRNDLERILLPGMPTGIHPGRKAYGGDGDAKKFGKALDDTPYQMNENGRHPFNVVTTTMVEAFYPTNILDIKKPRGQESIKGHQTQKPISLMRWLIDLASQPNDLILDCFGGTGTTGVASLESGRKIILIEQEQSYVDIMQERLGNILK